MVSNIKKTLNFKKLYSALSKSKIPLIVTDLDGKIIFVNKGIEFITGYSIEEVLGKTPSVWGGQMNEAFYKKLWDTIKRQKKNFTGKIINKNKNGQLFPVGIDISPVLNKKGEIEFFVATEYDMSKIKEAEQAIEEFISIASHQLKTPLTAIKWTIESLLLEKHGTLTDKQEEAMINIHSSNERLINLVNDLLNINIVESGGVIASSESLNIVQDISRVIKLYKPLALSRKQKIIFNKGKVPKMIIVDPILYSQIVQNLLSNALLYGKLNSNITVSLDRKKGFIIMRITNFGDQIPLMEQKSLFDKFFRGEEAKKMNVNGTGLGLYITKTAVEKIGGEIGFSSTKQKTEFYFTFPAKEPKSKSMSKRKQNTKN